MLKTENEKRISTSLFQFKPRQVMLLANQRIMKKKSEEKKTLLHHSVCQYLQTNGFSKTLQKFLSEANLPQDDSWKDCSLDLEQVYYKCLETRNQSNTNSDGCKEEDLQKVGVSKMDGVSDCMAPVETVSRKKKKKSDKSNCNAVDSQCQAKDELSNANKSKETVTSDLVPYSAVKSKMEKKIKTISGSIKEVSEQVGSDVLTESANGIVNEPLLGELKKKCKDKKKHKGKSGSESIVDRVEDDYQKEAQPAEGKSVKSKGKKRRKDGLVLESLPDKSIDELNNGKSRNNSQKDDFQTSEDAATKKENKDSKKRKRLVSEENNSQPIDKVAIEKCKRRKTEGIEESHPQLTELDVSLGKVCFNNSTERAITQLDTQANGNPERNGENSSVQKSSKKQHNGLVEPKTANAFQRVKIDKVVFTDERLQDNSYWAKDGAEIGYGAKAQEVLGQVRGRDFRHEKTKKKRGSYRGGQIDLHSHSVKFNYSDDD